MNNDDAMFFVGLKGMLWHIFNYFMIAIPTVWAFMGGRRVTYKEVVLIHTVPNYTAIPDGSWDNLGAGFGIWVSCLLIALIGNNIESPSIIIATVIEITAAMTVGGFIGRHQALDILREEGILEKEE